MRGKIKQLCSLLTLCFMLCIMAAAAKADDIVIVLDPGHGGTEHGAASSDGEYREELLTLKIAKYAKAELETYDGVTVYLTRTSNNIEAMDRETRVNFAKAKNATALVSIHLNAGSSTASYACALVPSTTNYPNSKSYAKKARALAKAILKQLNASVGITNNGFLFDDEMGIILYGMKAKIPSMIIEHCFISNPDDCENYLSSEAKLKKLGVADATGIANYYKLTKKTESSDSTETVKDGWQTENGNTYYYKSGTMVKSAWVKISGKYYYFNKNGVLKTGVFKKGKYLYLTNDEGVRQKGLVKYNGNWYIAKSNGQLRTGFVTYKNKRYYLDPTTGAAKTGVVTIDGDTYCFNKKTAVMRTGWIAISKKKTVYFGPATGKMQKNCWVGSKYKKYYVKSDGTRYKNTKKKINGKVYIFDKNGVCTNYYS